jgi:arylsulfatase A-like enzyme
MKGQRIASPRNTGISRRDFLKLAGLVSLTPLLNAIPGAHLQVQGGTISRRPRAEGSLPNILIILFDAMSAFNLSLYGYPRKTCPNLERFASRATVYHNHHSAGNFTTPSTASLFTSTYPWTHRAFNLSGLISPAVLPHNLFLYLPEAYHRAAFAQNVFADTLIYQCDEKLEQHARADSFTLVHSTLYNKLFPHDAIYGLKSYDQFLFVREEAHGSLLLSILNDLDIQLRSQLYARKYANLYPDGLPRLANSDLYFILGQVMEGVIDMVKGLPRPSFAYIHLMPPHEPYVPSRPFRGMFNDGWSPPAKKKHRLAPGVSKERLDARRQTYDEYIADLDAELGRLLDQIQAAGLFENSYIIVTSDHGEMFERGVHGHSNALVFEPGIRIPLLISAPGQEARQDIHALTSNVDLLPTLLQLSGAPIPDWSQGILLPGLGVEPVFSGEETPERSIYIVEAKTNAEYQPLTKATLALIKGRYKLIHYFGYRYYRDEYELYDLKKDPEELNNIYESHPAAKDLQAELEQKMLEADGPYLR